jgi:hypothetical protein
MLYAIIGTKQSDDLYHTEINMAIKKEITDENIEGQ